MEAGGDIGSAPADDGLVGSMISAEMSIAYGLV
jgi:hypothetical protein